VATDIHLDHQQALKGGAVEFFKHLGTSTDILNEDQTSVANLFPSMVSKAESQLMDQLCKLE
jgi:hypothetical protein